MKIILSVGHGTGKYGSYDPGAVYKGYHEYKIAKEVARYTRDHLKNYDCIVELINYNGEMYLYDRIAYVKKKNPNLVLEYHLNSSGGSNNGTGTEVYYKHRSSSGKTLAQKISKEISTALGLANRGAKIKTYNDNGTTKDYFGIVREPNCLSFLIENAFINNDKDLNTIKTAEGQKKAGVAIARAIISYYGLKPIHKPTPNPNPKPTGSIKIGDIVTINKGAKYGGSSRGKTVPSVQLAPKKHTVSKVQKNSGVEEALLKEIYSWVPVASLTLVKPRVIEVGSYVTVKNGAVYGGLSSSRGKKIPKEQLAPKKHKVDKIQVNKGVKECRLAGIYSWVAMSSLTLA